MSKNKEMIQKPNRKKTLLVGLAASFVLGIAIIVGLQMFASDGSGGSFVAEAQKRLEAQPYNEELSYALPRTSTGFSLATTIKCKDIYFYYIDYPRFISSNASLDKSKVHVYKFRRVYKLKGDECKRKYDIPASSTNIKASAFFSKLGKPSYASKSSARYYNDMDVNSGNLFTGKYLGSGNTGYARLKDVYTYNKNK